MPLSLNEQYRRNNPGLRPQAAFNTDVYNVLTELKTKYNLLLEGLHTRGLVTPSDLAALTVGATLPDNPDA